MPFLQNLTSGFYAMTKFVSGTADFLAWKKFLKASIPANSLELSALKKWLILEAKLAKPPSTIKSVPYCQTSNTPR